MAAPFCGLLLFFMDGVFAEFGVILFGFETLGMGPDVLFGGITGGSWGFGAFQDDHFAVAFAGHSGNSFVVRVVAVDGFKGGIMAR